MGDSSRLAEVFQALAHPYRRQLLVALLDHNPQDDSDVDPLDIFVSDGESDAFETELRHSHLPALEAKGFITWDRDTGEISKGPNWESIQPLMELIHENRDSLPEEWL